MALRELRDAQGELWRVWDVVPERRDRRQLPDRRNTPRSLPDRRKHRLMSAAVRPELSSGWLVFQSASAKRRLFPIPADWTRLSDSALLKLLEEALPAAGGAWPGE